MDVWFPTDFFHIIPRTSFFIPESPRWLMMKGKTAKARIVLDQFNNVEGAKQIEQEIEACLYAQHQSANWKVLLCNPVFVSH